MGSRVWGIPTWIFLHTLIAKLPDEKYVADEMLTQLKQLCSVLPCPDCANHATSYLNKIHAKHVPTRESFRQMLWTFHNAVNVRLKKPIFRLEQLAIYDRVHLGYVYATFLREFTKPLHNPRLFMDSMSRMRIVDRFKGWMTATFT